jgi:nucleotide-binding universal stress UspA family protein
MSIFPTKVLLATDGSKEADLAATTAADLAEKTNSELHIVTVAADPFLATDFTLHFPEGAERHRQEVRKEVQAMLDRQVERVQEAGERSLRLTSRWEERTTRSSPWPRSWALAW